MIAWLPDILSVLNEIFVFLTMLSLFYFSWILFTLISTTTQRNNGSTPSCFDFSDTKNGKTNSCSKKPAMNAPYRAFHRPPSIHCRIENTDIEEKSLCMTDVDSAAFTFQNNVMFETFFRKNGHRITSSFPNSTDSSYFFAFDIIVETYNITEITNKYINSTVNIHAPQAGIFLSFKNRTQNLPTLTVADEPYSISFQFLTIHVDCEDGGIAYYMVNGSSNSSNKPSTITECPQMSSKKQVSSLKFNSLEIYLGKKFISNLLKNQNVDLFEITL